jgi:hypothetical protein
MKVKFKKEGKLYTVDSLSIGIISDHKILKVLDNVKDVDSVYIPLKVNGEGYTDILVQSNLSVKDNYSEIRVKYDEKSEYVSPGCGIRKLYDHLSAIIRKPQEVKSIEVNANQIHDENKTVLYLNF